jgi:hypothetical protein
MTRAKKARTSIERLRSGESGAKAAALSML